jgi:hypothetical protein
MNEKLKSKKEIMNILPSADDAIKFAESQKESATVLIKMLSQAIYEKYDYKIRTNIAFDVIDKNKFRCTLSLNFMNYFSGLWFHFISFEKNLDAYFPAHVYAFSDRQLFRTAKTIDDFEKIIEDILKHKKTEILILSNL